MVSGIDLRHLGLKPLYSPASVSPLTPQTPPPPSQLRLFDQTVHRLPVAYFSERVGASIIAPLQRFGRVFFFLLARLQLRRRVVVVVVLGWVVL